MRKLVIDIVEFSGCMEELSSYIFMKIQSLNSHMLWVGSRLTYCDDDEVVERRKDAIVTKAEIQAYEEIYRELNKIFYIEECSVCGEKSTYELEGKQACAICADNKMEKSK